MRASGGASEAAAANDEADFVEYAACHEKRVVRPRRPLRSNPITVCNGHLRIGAALCRWTGTSGDGVLCMHVTDDVQQKAACLDHAIMKLEESTEAPLIAAASMLCSKHTANGGVVVQVSSSTTVCYAVSALDQLSDWVSRVLGDTASGRTS